MPLRYEYVLYKELDGDVFFAFKEWPTWARQLWFRRHLSNQERLRLFSFFFINGMDPDLIPRYVLKGNPDYDESAKSQMRFLVRRAKERPDTFFGYSMLARRVV